MWSTELERQGRDYSIGMKIPHMMRQLGVKDIDIRMSDKISFISPESYNYNEKMTDFIQAHEFYENKTDAWRTRAIDRFMNHGMDRKDAEHYCNKQNKITDFIHHNRETLAYTHLYGLLISFGTI